MKISLKDFDIKNDSEYNYFTHLYNLSFPIEERRPISNIYYLLNNNKKYSAKLIVNDDNKQLLGFLCYWVFDDFIFAEHLAIDSSIRGVGIGTKTMKLFISETTKPLILEIEEPNTAITTKRLHFYLNLGFKYWEELDYAQPPYIENTDAVPMKLLTLRDLPLDTNYDFIKRYLYKHVYKVSI